MGRPVVDSTWVVLRSTTDTSTGPTGPTDDQEMVTGSPGSKVSPPLGASTVTVRTISATLMVTASAAVTPATVTEPMMRSVPEVVVVWVYEEPVPIWVPPMVHTT